ncbi:MAG TPA: SMP-30/gluconolactonase/LRE family protein [Candidatus Saccharimonadia bacterium]|nr:SMP-30/gluconolactonase/LRE family protein [Candidatus Saccharimonadia bacterium]
MKISSPTPVGKYVSNWGEGPIWHRNRLLYVDIEAHKVAAYYPETGEEKIWDVKQRVGTVVPRQGGGLVFAGDLGFYYLNEDPTNVTPIADPEAAIETNRFNDGKCDAAGRFWAGTMHLGPKREATASLYCLHANLRVEKKFGPVTVSNGIVWTADNSTMYYIDTPRRNVLAFDFDLSSGKISNERVAFKTTDHEGSPDGMTIDAKDRLWVAFCHGSAVKCFDPKTGAVLAEVALPCREVTACAFGGPELKDLYITTGTPGSDVEPLAGRLFVAHTDVEGVPSHSFAG